MTGQDYLAKLRGLIEARLGALLPPAASDQLQCAIRHSLLAPAKRVRAILTMITTHELRGEDAKATDLACALEMVHAASLILDDLPAMDDAKMRRGLPANHKIYGEDTAILAAIALLNQSFGIISANETLSMPQRVAAIDILQWAIGLNGLVRGQHDDLHDKRAHMNERELEQMYARKTGALFAAAAEFGAIAANKTDLRAPMRQFGLDLGIGFQVLDDVLDARSTADMAGKDVAQDHGRTTFTSLMGVPGAVALGRSKIENALAAARAAAVSAGGDGSLFQVFTARLAGAFSDLMPDFQAEKAVN